MVRAWLVAPSLVAGWMILGSLIGTPEGAGAPAAGALDLRFVPPKATMVLAASTPAIGPPILEALRALKPDADGEAKTASKVQVQLLAVLGAPPDAIAQITAVGLRSAPHQDGTIIRTLRPHDFKKAAGFFGAGAVEKKHAGKAYYHVAERRPGFYYFPDDQIAVVAGLEADLHQFIDAGKAGAAQTPWAKVWQEVQDSHLAVAFDLAALRQATPKEQATPAAMLFGALWEKPVVAVLGATRGDGVTVRGVAVCASPEDAAGVKLALEPLLVEGRKGLKAGREALAADAGTPEGAKPLVRSALDLADGLLAKPRIRQEDNTVRIRVEVKADPSVALGAAWVLPALAKVRRAAP